MLQGTHVCTNNGKCQSPISKKISIQFPSDFHFLLQWYAPVLLLDFLSQGKRVTRNLLVKKKMLKSCTNWSKRHGVSGQTIVCLYITLGREVALFFHGVEGWLACIKMTTLITRWMSRFFNVLSLFPEGTIAHRMLINTEEENLLMIWRHLESCRR